MSTRRNLKSKKNLTRFTYETAAFQGWRLSISRAGTTFTRYFSDKQYGGEKEALAAAEPERFVVLDASGTPERIAAAIADVVEERVR